METVLDLYDRIINRDLLVRRVTVTVARIVPEDSVQEESFEQMDLFTDYGLVEKKKKEEQMALEKERKTQQMVLDIKKKFGKNADQKEMLDEQFGRIGGCGERMIFEDGTEVELSRITDIRSWDFMAEFSDSS